MFSSDRVLLDRIALLGGVRVDARRCDAGQARAASCCRNGQQPAHPAGVVADALFALCLLQGRHLVLAASLRERVVRELTEQPLARGRPEGAFDGAGAHVYEQSWRDALVRLAERDTLLVKWVNRYHAVKRAGLPYPRVFHRAVRPAERVCSELALVRSHCAQLFGDAAKRRTVAPRQHGPAPVRSMVREHRGGAIVRPAATPGPGR